MKFPLKIKQEIWQFPPLGTISSEKSSTHLLLYITAPEGPLYFTISLDMHAV
jgi:hypothetical protein